MDYFRHLSRRQYVWLGVTLLAAVLVILAGRFVNPQQIHNDRVDFTTDMSIKEMAPQLDVTGKALAREFELPLDVPKKRPVRDLGVNQAQLDHVTAHLLSHRPSVFKYFVFAAIALLALVYLLRLGRPDKSAGPGPNTQRLQYPHAVYVGVLIVAVVVCGFLLGKSPNPMEGVVKLFKSMVGLYPSVTEKVAAFTFFVALAIVGNKLVCGWVCPFGALQELIYSLPILKQLKRYKPPFAVTNAVRGGLFILMLLLLFGILGQRRGFVLYHAVNPFNLFDLSFEMVSIGVTIVVAIVLSLFVYRPFCTLICPFGFVSWVFERLSLARVRIDRDRCTACGACTTTCPTHAAADILNGKLLPADCFSCTRCLRVCPHDAIRYGPVFVPLSPSTAENKTAS